MAKRLIDSADLIAKLPIVEEDKQVSLIGAVADVVTMISECKPVDAVEVCYCKDCQHSREYSPQKGFGYCYHWSGDQGLSLPEVEGNDFCSRGERRCE